MLPLQAACLAFAGGSGIANALAVARLMKIMRPVCNMESPILFDFYRRTAMALAAIWSILTTSCNSVLHRENMTVKRIGKGCRSLIEFTKQAVRIRSLEAAHRTFDRNTCGLLTLGTGTGLGWSILRQKVRRQRLQDMIARIISGNFRPLHTIPEMSDTLP